MRETDNQFTMKISVCFLLCLVVGWSQAWIIRQSSCYSLTCRVREKCLLVYESGVVFAACIARRKAPKRNRCGSSGFPIVYKKAGGRRYRVMILSKVTANSPNATAHCPSAGFVLRRNRCCYDTDRVTVCPPDLESVYNINITGCSPLCKGDNFCRKSQKCCGLSCESMRCVRSTYATPTPEPTPLIPKPSCSVVRCPPGYVCVMQQVNCRTPPCDPSPTCVDKCLLPVETGTCLGLLEPYFYNNTTQRCEIFIYSGCGGNANNFDSYEQCQEGCAKHICSLPSDSGREICSMHVERYFYDNTTQTCQTFVYYGCGGNSNNFVREEECKKFCAENILRTGF